MVVKVNIVIFSLGPLVNKVKEFQVEGIVETLCANMLSDTEQLRDISSIGLKTVISELPLGSNTLAANVCKKITGKLSSAIEKVVCLYFISQNTKSIMRIKTLCKELSVILM